MILRVLASRRALLVLAMAVVGVAAIVVVFGVVGGESTKQEPVATSAPASSDDVISSLQQRVREDPEDFDAHLDLANAYLQKVRENADSSLYTKAEGLLERAEELDPKDPELLATRGVLSLARHEFAAALEFGEEAVAANPESARNYGIVGDAQIELGMYEEAVGTYQEMVDRRPDFNAYSRVAHARELYGDPEGAVEAMEDTIAAGGPTGENAAWASVELGNLRFKTGDLDAAAEDYGRALSAFPNYPLALAGKGRVAAARGELEDAAALFQEAFNRMPLPEHAIALGDVYTRMGEEQKAKEQYELVRVIDQLFQAAGVNTDLEIALFLADHDLDLPKSLQKARAAYEARPSIHAADALAWTLYKTGDYEEAEEYSSEALKLGTRDSLKLFHAAMIARELDQDEQAEKYLRQALDANPHFSLLYSDNAAAELEELERASAEEGE